MEVSSEIKEVIWDLDGTLLNSFKIFKGLVTDIAPEFEVSTPDKEAFLANFHGPIRSALDGLFGKLLDSSKIENFTQRFLERQDSRYAQVEEYLWTYLGHSINSQ